MKIENWLQENFGYDPKIRNRWFEYIDMWRSWLIGFNKEFHVYQIWNGKAHIERRRKSLQMAKKICEDWSNILFNINCTVIVEDEASNENLQQLLAKNNFWLMVNQTIEAGFAVGTAGIVLSVIDFEYDEMTRTVTITENTRPVLEVVDVSKIYPLSWDDKRCTECAFVTSKTIKGERYAIVSLHLLENGEYVIRNRSFKLNQNGDFENPLDDGTEGLETFEEFRTGSELPWFVLISPSCANNIMLPTESAYDYPFGISIYANAIDALKSVDLAFDAIDTEITIGRMRIFASESMMKTINGEMVFDATDIAVYVLPQGLQQDQLLQPVAPSLRVSAMSEALTADLSVLSQNVGMGRQMYDLSVTNMSTAAQVYSVNSELKRSRDKHKTALEDRLYDILTAFCNAATAFTGFPINPDGLMISFDETMFEDKTATADRARLDFESGLISAWEYRILAFGEDKETAKARVEEIKAEKMRDTMALMAMQEQEV